MHLAWSLVHRLGFYQEIPHHSTSLRTRTGG